jgi:predicted permease
MYMSEFQPCRCACGAGTGILMAMLKLGWYTSPDPLFMLVLLLCHAQPTAMNLQTVATLNQNGEAEMSCILCWQYLAALVTLPLWMTFFVVIVSP